MTCRPGGGSLYPVPVHCFQYLHRCTVTFLVAMWFVRRILLAQILAPPKFGRPGVMRLSAVERSEVQWGELHCTSQRLPGGQPYFCHRHFSEHCSIFEKKSPQPKMHNRLTVRLLEASARTPTAELLGLAPERDKRKALRVRDG